MMVLEAGGVTDGEVSVTLLDDVSMIELSRDHLDLDSTTDVISFALHEGDEAVLGDVYVGHEQAARQAADMGVSLTEELARLAIHGTLHVLGYDHPEGDSRNSSEMFVIQERLVRTLLEASDEPLDDGL
jgi:probable rRNA maturation factor